MGEDWEGEVCGRKKRALSPRAQGTVKGNESMTQRKAHPRCQVGHTEAGPSDSQRKGKRARAQRDEED